MPRMQKPKLLQLPDPNFVAAPVRTWSGTLFDLRRSAGFDFANGDPILDGSPLANVD